MLQVHLGPLRQTTGVPFERDARFHLSGSPRRAAPGAVSQSFSQTIRKNFTRNMAEMT